MAPLFQLSPGQFGAINNGIGLEVLDELRHKNTAQTVILQPAQVFQRFRLGDRQALFPADMDHILVEVDPAARSSLLLQQLQELTTTAAHIEHHAAVTEIGQVNLLPLLDQLLRTAENIFK